MEYKIFSIFWLCGVLTFCQVSSKISGNIIDGLNILLSLILCFPDTDTQYLHQHKLHSESRTRIVPLHDRGLRLRRDVNSTEKEVNVSTTAETVTEPPPLSTPASPAVGPGTDQLEKELNKVLTENDDEVHKNLHSPETNFKFDNVSIQREKGGSLK